MMRTLSAPLTSLSGKCQLRNGHVIYPDWKGASVWAQPLYQRVMWQ